MLKGTQYINSLSNNELIELIQEFKELYIISGTLPPNSKVNEIIKIYAEETLSHNLKFVEQGLMWAVFTRFENIIKK